MTFDQRHSTWANSNRFVPRVFVQPFKRFTQIEAGSGIVLLVAAAVALVWANSSYADSYFHLFEELIVEFQFGPIHLEESFGHMVNDGLMAIFFFVVGLEIKRELVLGELRDPKVAALPVMAALGGMVVPASIYVALASGTPGAGSGWGIPMATDIAFAVGVLSLLGRRVPAAGKLFILALAIADDVGAILVIAIFYTSDLSFVWLIGAVAGLGVVTLAQRVGVRSLAFYWPVAIAIWFALLESGVHATLAGVALGLLTPARPLYSPEELDRRARQILDMYPLGDTVEDREHADHEAMLLTEISRESVSPLARLEHKMLPWSSFVVIPLFALANAGVSFAGTDVADLITHPVSLGVGLGLLFGKPIGITLFTWLAVRLRIGRMPVGTRWPHIIGLGLVAGIGFTVALFVTALAFDDPRLGDIAKVGIFAGSIIAAILGAVVLLSTENSVPETDAESAALSS
ncbi:MAG TPA: Na+/H+ antiporter NhaA [Acidimicrobiia bacterium]|jgi:NhaA family Na+:H+ antiporter|nr:Na+/H+ antiporter NhaA [Acidimicrobiia bacterium]